MIDKPEPSKEEIIEKITDILKEGESPKRKPDAETDKLVTGLTEILFAKPRGYNPEPDPDWVARLFTKLVVLPLLLVNVTLSMAGFVGSVLFLYKVEVDPGTLLAFILSGLPIANVGALLAFEDAGADLRRRKGRKASRYIWFVLIWSALLFVVAWDWPVVLVCVVLVFVTQVCLPWLVEKIFIPLLLGASVLEAGFRRMVGVPEPPLELISEVKSGAE